MSNKTSNNLPYPSAEMIQKALEIYRQHAYGSPWPDHIKDLIPPEGFCPEDWFKHDMAECLPYDVPLEEINSIAYRLGNAFYPNMKFRLSLTPERDEFIFSVDSHDEVLVVTSDSPEKAMLEELKANNAVLNKKISQEWNEEGILTEKGYLRQMIVKAKEGMNK